MKHALDRWPKTLSGVADPSLWSPQDPKSAVDLMAYIRRPLSHSTSV